MNIKECIYALQMLGLQAEESKLEPGSIVGGTSSTEIKRFTSEESLDGSSRYDSDRVFHEAFFIRPSEDGGALINVTGPGCRVTYRTAQRLEDAPEEVLSVYRERCIHVRSKHPKG